MRLQENSQMYNKITTILNSKLFSELSTTKGKKITRAIESSRIGQSTSNLEDYPLITEQRSENPERVPAARERFTRSCTNSNKESRTNNFSILKNIDLSKIKINNDHDLQDACTIIKTITKKIED